MTWSGEHLRHLVLLTMLNYPAVRLESVLSEEEWLVKQKKVVQSANWGGDVEVQLMSMGLKRNIISQFITTYSKNEGGGVFLPLTYDDKRSTKDLLYNSSYVIYNGCNHYDSTVHWKFVSNPKTTQSVWPPRMLL